MQNPQDWYLIYRSFGGKDEFDKFNQKLNTIREGFVHDPFSNIQTKDERIIEAMASLSMDCDDLKTQGSPSSQS